MARRNSRGYRGYQGRRNGSSMALKIIVALLAVLLVLGILFVIILGKYVEYTDNGVRLNLPWNQTNEPDEPGHSDQLIIVTEEPTPSSEPDRIGAIGALEVTASQVKDGSAARLAAEAEGNAMVVEVKNAYGKLVWQSENERAVALKVNAADNGFAQAVTTLAGEDDLYLVARVCCFRDQALASAGIGGPLMTRGGNVWYDANGLRWVSPASPEVRDYLTALCAELSRMGFDEILLDCAGYPDLGEVGVLATDDRRPEDLSTPVSAFYAQVAEALADSGTILSIQATEQMTQLPGEIVYSGIIPSVLARYAGRVWLPEELSAEHYTALLGAAGLEEPEKHLVVENGEKESGSWYVTG